MLSYILLYELSQHRVTQPLSNVAHFSLRLFFYDNTSVFWGCAAARGGVETARLRGRMNYFKYQQIPGRKCPDDSYTMGCKTKQWSINDNKIHQYLTFVDMPYKCFENQAVVWYRSEMDFQEERKNYIWLLCNILYRLKTWVKRLQ